MKTMSKKKPKEEPLPAGTPVWLLMPGGLVEIGHIRDGGSLEYDIPEYEVTLENGDEIFFVPSRDVFRRPEDRKKLVHEMTEQASELLYGIRIFALGEEDEYFVYRAKQLAQQNQPAWLVELGQVGDDPMDPQIVPVHRRFPLGHQVAIHDAQGQLKTAYVAGYTKAKEAEGQDEVMLMLARVDPTKSVKAAKQAKRDGFLYVCASHVKDQGVPQEMVN
jgi:hypothetical protein